jgi:hypothetical protein
MWNFLRGVFDQIMTLKLLTSAMKINGRQIKFNSSIRPVRYHVIVNASLGLHRSHLKKFHIQIHDHSSSPFRTPAPLITARPCVPCGLKFQLHPHPI